MTRKDINLIAEAFGTLTPGSGRFGEPQSSKYNKYQTPGSGRFGGPMPGDDDIKSANNPTSSVYGIVNTADGPTLVGLYASQEQAQQALNAFLATPEGKNEADYCYITLLDLGQPVNFDYIYDTLSYVD